MSEKKFRWLIDRASPGNGPELVRGVVYAAADFDAAVVTQWVRTGAAEWTTEHAAVKPEVHAAPKTRHGKREK